MTRRTNEPLVGWFAVWDLTLTAAAWCLAYVVRFRAGLIPITRDVPDFEAYVGSLPLVLVLAIVSYKVVGLYQVHRLNRVRDELVAVAKGVAFLTLLLAATSFARQATYESRAAMLLFPALACAARVPRPPGDVVHTWPTPGTRFQPEPRAHRRVRAGSPAAPFGPFDTRTGPGIQPVAYVEDDSGTPAPTDLPVAGRHRRPAPARGRVPHRARLHRPAHEPIRRRPTGVRPAVADASWTCG